MGIEIRPYRSGDRAAVREVCYLTGYMGENPDWYWRDQESFADMFSLYYTDGEPESLFVAHSGDEIVGYLLGCVDSARVWDPVRLAARHAVRRACLLRPGTAPVMWRTLSDVLVGMMVGQVPVTKPFTDPRWPSHLHINLLDRARGTGAGRGLMEAWLERLRSVGSPGCHIETLAENTRAIGFFGAMGFELFGEPQVVPGERARDGSRLHRQVMVQTLG